MIATRKIEDSVKVENPFGINVKRVYDQPSAQVMHVQLMPGEELKKHSSPVDVCFYVLQGIVEFEIDDETINVGPDAVVESPAGGLHRIANNGDEPVRFLVIKAPRPGETPNTK